jgi:transmembrane sensor
MSKQFSNSFPEYLKSNLEEGSALPEQDIQIYDAIWNQASQFKYPEANTELQWSKLKAGITNEKITVVKTKQLKYYMFRWVAAAVIVLVCGIGFYQFKLGSDNGFTGVYTTLDNQEKVILPDGSTVVLNENSELNVEAYNAYKRNVVLVKGEAYFNVNRDQRPFVVATQNGSIKVHGTQFNINAYNQNNFEVFLKEGKIEWIKGTQDVFLKPGQLLKSNQSGKYSIQDLNDNRSTIWLDDKLVFKNSNFKEMIQVLEAHYEVKFVYDAALENEVVTISCQDLNAEQVASLLSKTLNTQITVK